MMTKTKAAFTAILLTGTAASTAAANVVSSENAYLDMGFEELLSVEVTSGARRAQTVEDSAASVFVISQDDIRRSPARNVPELLRMVPGVQVQRLDYNNYRVSIRGGAQVYSNKLLVMIDGRSIYTPVFGGVFWDQHDLLLDDIERIEVVRGPGGTVWGANATNGVINIITKSAADTEGLYLNAEFGDEDRPTVGVRVGGKLSTGGAVRVGAQYSSKPNISPNELGVGPLTGIVIQGPNDYETGKIDFRLDQPLGDKTMFTLTAALQEGEFGEAFTSGTGFLQAHVLGRVERETARGGVTVQVFADHSDREAYIGSAAINTFDIDLSHHFETGRHHFIWGSGFRFQDDKIASINLFEENTDWRASFFAQDEISFRDDAVNVTLGSKFEYNSITGFEYQPSVRALWRLTERRTLWAALSRNVRTPSRADRGALFDVALDPATSTPFTLLGGDVGDFELDAETSLTAEIGYRTRITDRYSLEASVFGTRYDNLIVQGNSPETQPPFFPVFANRLQNVGEGRSIGVEIAANANPIDPLTLQLAYAYIDLDVDNEQDEPLIFDNEASRDLVFSERGTSQHTASLRGSLELPQDVTASAWVRYTAEPVAMDIGDGVDLDLRLSWAPGPVRASLIAENLLSDDDDFEGTELISPLTELSPSARRLTAKLELDL